MKKILLFPAFVIFSFAFSQIKNRADLLSIPGPLTFNETEFYLDYSNQLSKTLYIQQYLPKDEKFENFNQFLGISYFNKQIETQEAVKQKLESIDQRSAKDKYAKPNVTQSPDGKEYIVDYTITETPEKGDSYAEYNIYRFKEAINGEKKSFIIFSYATRVYGDVKYAVKILSKERNALMSAMADFQIPTVKLANDEPSKILTEEPKPIIENSNK